MYVEAVQTTIKPCCPPGPAYLIAMNASTGAQLWQTQVGESRALVNLIVGP